jgi:hypothetical protein
LHRHEAVQLLQEIFKSCQDETLVNFVFLRHAAKHVDVEDFELHLKASISDSTLDIIESIAKKHQFSVMQSGGYVIFSSPDKLPQRITASF